MMLMFRYRVYSSLVCWMLFHLSTQTDNNVTPSSAGIMVYPEVLVTYRNSSNKTYRLLSTNDSTPAGIYKQLDRDGRLTFGCGLLSNDSEIDMETAFSLTMRISTGVQSEDYAVILTCTNGQFLDGQSCWLGNEYYVPQNQSGNQSRSHYGFFPELNATQKAKVNITNAKTSTVTCQLTHGNAQTILAYSTFDWWDPPTRISIYPKHIEGYQQQSITATCESEGGSEHPVLQFYFCDVGQTCPTKKDDGSGYNYESSFKNVSGAYFEMKLYHFEHHGKILQCGYAGHGVSITHTPSLLNITDKTDDEIIVKYLSRNERTPYSLQGPREDVRVKASSYIYHVGDVDFLWTTDPPFPSANNITSDEINLQYANYNSHKLKIINVTCVVTLRDAPHVRDAAKANKLHYRTELKFRVEWASVSVRDTVVLIILIALAVLGMVACVGACVTTVLNRHKQGRRSTIATDMETDFDYKDNEGGDADNDEAEVDISPAGTVTVRLTTRRASSAASRRRSTLGGNEIGRSLAQRRLSTSRRQNVDERRMTLANEALLLAETVKKSLNARKSLAVAQRGVSFADGAGSDYPSGDEGLARIPGTHIFIRNSLIPRSERTPVIAEETSQPHGSATAVSQLIAKSALSTDDHSVKAELRLQEVNEAKAAEQIIDKQAQRDVQKSERPKPCLNKNTGDQQPTLVGEQAQHDIRKSDQPEPTQPTFEDKGVSTHVMHVSK